MSRDDLARRARKFEAQLLGGLVLMPHAHPATRLLLRDGDLIYFAAHQLIYRKIGELGKATSLPSVGLALGTKALETIGGIAGLSGYVDEAYASTEETVQWLAAEVADQGCRRKLVEAAGEFQQKVGDGEDIRQCWDDFNGVYNSLVLSPEELPRRAAG